MGLTRPIILRRLHAAEGLPQRRRTPQVGGSRTRRGAARGRGAGRQREAVAAAAADNPAVWRRRCRGGSGKSVMPSECNG